MKVTHLKLLALFPLCATASFAQLAETVSLRNGQEYTYNGVTSVYEGTSDTSIRDRGHNNRNFGGGTALFIGTTGEGTSAGNTHVLLRFDLSAFAGSVATSDATISLYQVSNGTTPVDFDLSAYRIVESNANWIEGTGDGGATNLGLPGATWNNKNYYGADNPNNAAWLGGAGVGSGGYDTEALAGFSFVQDDNFSWLTFTIAQSVIQGWIDNPETNGGILIKADSHIPLATGAFRSSEFSTISVRPELSFELQQIPEPATYGMLFGAVAIGAAFVARRRRQVK